MTDREFDTIIGTIRSLVLLLIGIIIGISYVGYDSKSTFSVGDCVRELGSEDIMKVTVVTESGSIEVQGRYLYKYTLPEQQNLIKVECE